MTFLGHVYDPGTRSNGFPFSFDVWEVLGSPLFPALEIRYPGQTFENRLDSGW